MSYIQKNAEDKILAFTKYAHFIAGKFGVKIEFNGVNAHTNGKVITLPNLLGMSQKEIDFLYGILLHEAGHIKYSDFSVNYFSHFKTQNHAFIANALEDARIENLLMVDYDGAKDILDDLYNLYMGDEIFVKKIFGFKKNEIGDFQALNLYLHNYYVKIPNKAGMSNLVNKKTLKKLNDFIEKHKLDKVLKSHPLESVDDVLTISQKIYDMYSKDNLDMSEPNTIEEMQDVLENKSKSIMDKIEADFKAYTKKQDKFKALEKELNTKIEELTKTKMPIIDKLEQDMEKLEDQSYEIDEYLSLKDELNKTGESLQSAQEKIDKKQKQFEELSDSIKELEEKIKEIDPTKSEKDAAKEAKLKERLDKYNERLKKFDSQKQSHLTKKENLSNNLKSQDENFKKLDEKFKDLTEDELIKLSNDLSDKISELDIKISNEQSEISSSKNQLGQIRSENKIVKNEFSKQSLDSMVDLQDEFTNSELPVSIIPEFQAIDGWDQANELQQEFDKKATQEVEKIVRNGAAIGTDVRDILLMLDNAKEQIQQIDLSELFKDKFDTSKIGNLNELSQFNNIIESAEKIDPINFKKHIPSTTLYDKITIKTNGSSTETQALKTKNIVVTKRLKEIFAAKMKLRKKDHFKGGKEEGNLDTRNLWKLATKQDNDYFEVNLPKPINDVSASIAIDISGSMDKDYNEQGEKLKELSLILSDALQGNFIKHEICGFHAPISPEMINLHSSSTYNRKSNHLETMVYKKFEDKSNSGVSNMEIMGGDNSDGESIKIIAKRLLKERSKRKIMFIISDNKPYLSDGSPAVLDSDLFETIKWCLANKIEMYSLSFNEGGERFFKEYACHIKKYNDLINFCQIKIRSV